MGCELSPLSAARSWIGGCAGRGSRSVEIHSNGRVHQATLLNLGADCAVIEAPFGARIGDRVTLTLEDGADLTCSVERVRGIRLQLAFVLAGADCHDCPWPLQRAA